MARKPARFLRFAFLLSVVVAGAIIPVGLASTIESILDANPSCEVVDSREAVSPDNMHILISKVLSCKTAFSVYTKATLILRQNNVSGAGVEVFSGATENPIAQISWSNDSSVVVVLPNDIVIGYYEPSYSTVRVNLKWRDGRPVSWP